MTLHRRGDGVGVMMIPIPARGMFRGVDGVGEAESVPGVTGVTITAPCDQPILPLPEGESYLGFIFARGDTAADAEQALRDAHARLRIRIEPMITLRPFVCACPRVAKVVVTAALVGLLTGFFGVGGGFALVPALVLALGFPMPTAVGT